MSNPDKSGRQNMLREEIQEIQDIHGHNPMFATIPVHFVDMWVVEQIGTPGMENGSHSAPDSFMMSEGLDGLPGGLEHGIVEDGLMCHRKRIETGRDRKDDMKVFRRDDLFLAKIDPLFPLLVRKQSF